jgi:hypothetical protein
MRYLIEGRIIPERVDCNFPRISGYQQTVDGKEFEVRIQLITSKIFVHVDTKTHDIPIPDIRNMIQTTVGDLANLVGFHLVMGASYELDSITNIDDQATTVFGTEGFVFNSLEEFGDRITFKPGHFGAPLAVTPDLISNRAFSRATFELRCSIRYPDYTALHCRLAIEAVRNAFDADDETIGWQRLRENLRVRRETIELFKDAAAAQRHGKAIYQTWAQRRQCMQIAWEIVHRFAEYMKANPPARLKTPEL